MVTKNKIYPPINILRKSFEICAKIDCRFYNQICPEYVVLSKLSSGRLESPQEDVGFSHLVQFWLIFILRLDKCIMLSKIFSVNIDKVFFSFKMMTLKR